MKQEEKDLLLKDLSARLPYKVICNASIRSNKTDTPPISSDYCLTHNLLNYVWIDCRKLKPYLRSMSSMTEEEQVSLKLILPFGVKETDVDFAEASVADTTMIIEYIDWLNRHHFDYRGLIKKGLALEAPEGMYKI